MQASDTVGFLFLFAFIALFFYWIFTRVMSGGSDNYEVSSYKWADAYDGLSRKSELGYTGEINVGPEERRSVGKAQLSSRESYHYAAEYDPTAEPELPFGRFAPPIFVKKSITPLEMQLWKTRMKSQREAFHIDKPYKRIVKEIYKEIERTGLDIVSKQETEQKGMNMAAIDASGYNPNSKDRIFARLVVYGSRKSAYSDVEIEVFSRNEEDIVLLTEQLKQALWQ